MANLGDQGTAKVAYALGIVVIGRNEGERLKACLSSVQSALAPFVYVDSGSCDDSVRSAREAGALVVQLDARIPFSAARARNEGAAQLRLDPAIEFIQFLDGDCTLLTGWLDAAMETMRADPTRAVVIGPLVERHPEASYYNRLCALEWKSMPGELTNFGALGGIMLVRADVFAQLGGFDEQVIAGEDSEFGVRVAMAGF
ncbi:MAG: glycosyltransferase family A protein, partial [Dokdonella sp.]